MVKMKCSICGYVHDEADGLMWDDLAGDWVCPWCKAEKSAFVVDGEAAAAKEVDTSALETEDKELSPLELSALCSNLAKGCEKQYLPEQAELFTKLAAHYKGKAEPQAGDMAKLLELVNEELATTYPLVEAIGTKHGDRGALRAYTWGVKVTMILQSLLERYADTDMANTGVYVCTICGFVYVGDAPPELCPICKVPQSKFEEIGGE